jgi:hypothetical protein
MANSDTIEQTGETSNQRSKVIRSTLTIALYAIAGPLFGAGFLIGISELPSLPRFFGSFGLAFLAAPIVGIGAYPVGLVPALMTGCLSALLSPVTPSSLKYIMHSVVIGAITSGLMMIAFNARNEMLFKVIGAGAVAAFCCAVISNLFRFRPSQ